MTAARPVMPPGVEDRNADVWEPLLAIADAVGWAQEARSAAVELIGAARDAEPSLGIRLLADVRTLFDASTLDPASDRDHPLTPDRAARKPVGRSQGEADQ